MQFKTSQELYTSREIKKEAKVQLEGQWGKAVLMALVPAVFSFIFFRNTAMDVGETSLRVDFFNILVDIISNFLVVGVTFSFMNLLRNRSYILAPLQEILSPFKSKYFSKLFLLQILKYFYIFLWTLLFIIPGIVKAYGYSQAELIYKDTVDRTGEQPDARAVLEESQNRMMGHKMDLFALDLSFIGWQIFAVFTFGILYLWLTPYTAMSRVVFYENLTEGYYLKGERVPKNKDTNKQYDEVGKDPDDFRDFEDF